MSTGLRTATPVRLRSALPSALLACTILGLYIGYALAFGHPAAPPGPAYWHEPTRFDPLVHWDGGWYQYVALHGYAAISGSSEQPQNFFPLFPLTTAAVHAALPRMSLLATGILLNAAATVLSMVFIDRSFPEWPMRQRLGLIAFLLTVPMAMFYVAFYAEALCVLGIAMTIWGLRGGRRRMWLAALGVTVATLARPLGVIVILPLALSVWRRRGELGVVRAAGVVACAAAGVPLLLTVYAVSAHDPLAFVHAHGGWSDLPLNMGLRNAVRAIRNDLLFRAGADLAATSVGWWVALLATVSLVTVWLWNRDLAVYAAVAVAASVVLGGLGSQGRYMLVILPVFIAPFALWRRFRVTWVVAGCSVVLGFAFNLWLIDGMAGWRWAG